MRSDWKTTTTSTKFTPKPTTTILPETTTEPGADNGSDESLSIVGKESADINTKALQAKSVNDNHKVLFGQHATIALISTFLFITVVLILVFVMYKIKTHSRILKNKQETYLPEKAVTSEGKKNKRKQMHSNR